MATRKSPRLNGPAAKARKLDDQSKFVGAAAPAVVVESTPAIFNLANDCCYAILDWLCIDDLRSFGQTCKWAQRVAANFYKMNYASLNLNVDEYRKMSSSYIFDLESAQRIRIAQGIRVGSTTKLDAYRYIETYCSQPIKQIHLVRTTLSVAKVNCLKKVLLTVECVILDNCTISGGFYQNFLKFCGNIKKLCIHSGHVRNAGGYHILIGTDNDWLTRKYPTLEHLDMQHDFTQKIVELKTFFKQNPNVRNFTTYSNFFLENLEFFRNIKLDKLEIGVESKDRTKICKHLITLHGHGVFHRLQLDDVLFDEIPSLNTLHEFLYSRPDIAELSPLPVSIKKMRIVDSFSIETLTIESFVRNVVGLESVCLGCSTIEIVMNFACRLAKLKKIRITRFWDIKAPTKLDIAAWNKQRKKLAGAEKVTIYVPENLYLATKWATNKTDYSLIELKREHSYDCDYGSYFTFFMYTKDHYIGF